MIQRTQRTVFYAPTRGRHYFTARAAAKGEASAMMIKHYPSERADFDSTGACTYGGRHWSADADLSTVAARLERALLRKLRKESK